MVKNSAWQFEQSHRVTPFTPFRASSEHIRSAQCKLREGSVAIGTEMLRCAQHDRAGPFCW